MNRNLHTLLQRPASIPEAYTPLAEIPLPASFENAQRAPLLQWLDDARSIPELETRGEAIRRLLNNARQRKFELNLSDLSLTELPPSLGAARWLRRLNLARNQLTELPQFLAGIPNLEMLDLSDNQITQLSGNLNTFPPNCLISLGNNPVTPPVLIAPGGPRIVTPPNTRRDEATGWREAAPSPASVGIPLNQDVQARLLEINQMRISGLWNDSQIDRTPDQLTRKFAHQIGDAIDLWRAQSGGFGALLRPLTPDLWTALRKTPYAGSFALWLARLRDTADFQQVPLRAPLQRRVLHVLEAVFNDKATREICFALAHESVETCGDRIALGLAQMEMALINLKAERGDLSPEALFDLGAKQFCMHEISRIALEHTEYGEFINALVEVELAFQVGLREQLNLPIGNQSILFEVCAEVGLEDLDDAEERILARRNQPPQTALAHLDALDEPECPTAHTTDQLLETPEPHPLAHFLAAHYRPWGQQVERDSAQAIETFRNKMYACLEELSARTAQHLISEVDYRQACDDALFFANHGVAYRRALEHIHNQAR